MKKSEELVHDTYFNHPEIWEDAWKKYVIRRLAEAAKGYFTSISPLILDAQIASLADSVIRVRLVSSPTATDEIINKYFCKDSKFQAFLMKSFQPDGVNLPSQSQLGRILIPFVEQSLKTVKSSDIVTSVSEHEVYSELANILSEQLHAVAVANHPPDETLALNYSILIYHLRRWRIPFQNLAPAIQNFNQGLLGLRGRLISIQNRHRPAENCDDFSLPIVSFTPSTLPSEIQAHSDILKVVQSESKAIPDHSGFLHRAMPISIPVDASVLSLSPIVTQSLAEDGRRLNYPQLEHTALLFMSLTSIEFLLRSFCPTTYASDDSLTKVINLHTALPTPIRDQIVNIFSTEHWNIRNRCMHGSFLELEGRREDLIRSSGILQGHGVPIVDLSSDGSLPENVSAIVLKALNDLAHHLKDSANECDTAWTHHFLLTPSELIEAKNVRCDFLQDKDSAEGWRIQISDYLREVTPCLSTPLQLGVRSWFMPWDPENTMPGFYFLTLLFEPFLRLTLHMAKRPVLKRSMSSDSTSKFYRIQYCMLNANELLTPDNIAWVIDHLNATEKPVAERFFQLAMKCRDAFAHGAIFQFTDDIRRTYGHMIVKAIQIVVEAGQRHLQASEMQ